jgi:signal transduction histidine kinase
MTTITDSVTPVKTADTPAARVLRQLGTDSVFVLTGFPLGVVAFVLMITGFSLGAGLLVIVVGLPVWATTLVVARGFAEVERTRIAAVLRRPRVRVPYRRARPDAGAFRRTINPLLDVQYWLDLLHGVLRFPLAIATFVIVVTWWSIALGGLTYVLWDWALPHSPDNYELPELLGFEDTPGVRIAFYVVIGIVAALTLPLVVRGSALAQAWLGHALLTSVAQLRSEISGLTEANQNARAQTVAAVSAEATALRRLERDIHDGPQQRLVRLAVDLGRARSQVHTDPEAAQRTVDEALDQAQQTLAELRQLSRGIAPPILTDRGLTAAVAALAARSTVPVELDVPDLGRLSPIAETTAYFTIAEALTNVAKHSRATLCEISVRVADDRLTLCVRDNGVGGAHPAMGHGLAGLTQRLHAAGGELRVTSPSGGPTELRAELPCRNPA